MKLLVFLSRLLLHFLLLHWTESEEEKKVNLTTLARIIDFFEQNYSIKTGAHKPYAVAINVPSNHCQENFDSSILPTKENATRVRNDIYIKDNKFYEGKDLIAAGLLACNEKINASEICKTKPVFYLLTNGSSSFINLLKRTGDSCVVIYSLYYPFECKPNDYDIIPALDTLKNHSGIKAFVFSKFHGVDKSIQNCSSLAKNCTEIVQHVPIYHFVNNTVNIKQCQD